MFNDDKIESKCPANCQCRNLIIRQALDGITISTKAYYNLQSVLNEVCDFCKKQYNR